MYYRITYLDPWDSDTLIFYAQGEDLTCHSLGPALFLTVWWLGPQLSAQGRPVGEMRYLVGYYLL